MTKIAQVRSNNVLARRLKYVESENILQPDKKHYPTQSARLTRQTTIKIMERNCKIVGGEQISMRLNTTKLSNFIESTHLALTMGLGIKEKRWNKGNSTIQRN